MLFAGVIIAIGPFLWMISASFMTLSEVNLTRLLPENLLWENYATALRRANFLDIEIATLIRKPACPAVAEHLRLYLEQHAHHPDISVLGSLAVCIPAAYAFARMKFIGRNFIFALFLSTMMIPGIVMLIPHLLDRDLAGPAQRKPVWSRRRLVQQLAGADHSLLRFGLQHLPAAAILHYRFPHDLWEAARIDGAGHPRFLISVVLPLSKAPIMTIVTLGFIGSWNALMWPLLVTINDEWRPIAVGLSNFVTADTPGDLNLQMAASVITVIPILVLYFVAQKQFTEGIAQTGIRG